jgi:hypothetical protein
MLLSAVLHPVNRLAAAKYEGRALVADDDGVSAAAEIYSIRTATSTAGIYQMPLQAPAGERKMFGRHFGCFVGGRKGFSDINKKN